VLDGTEEYRTEGTKGPNEQGKGVTGCLRMIHRGALMNDALLRPLEALLTNHARCYTLSKMMMADVDGGGKEISHDEQIAHRLDVITELTSKHFL